LNEEDAMRDLRVSFPRPCEEKWEAMTPAGRARICARCDKAVHDLASYTLDEAKELLRDPQACVRARIRGDGSIALKPSRGSARRMVIAAAATAGLLTAGAPALAKGDQPGGTIAGRVKFAEFRTRVTATDTEGRIFRTKVKSKGQFRIRHLPAGTYSLSFKPGCGESWTIADVVVGAGETSLPNIESPDGCITVGMLRIEEVRG
jgi:hypothetical protein